LDKHELEDFYKTLFCQSYQEKWEIKVQEVEHEGSNDQSVLISSLELEITIIVVTDNDHFVNCTSNNHED